jgi:hypothetical protein
LISPAPIRWLVNMQIKSFEFNVIEAKRFSKAGERIANIRIDQNSSITQVMKLSEDSVSVDFRFTANYAGMGFIKIEGQIIGEGHADSIMAEWSKDGSMPVEEANVVHNTIVSNCLPTALLVARDIKLPPPFPLPHINVQKKGAIKPGSGVEVA